jgi:hypothetical protein
LREKRCHELKIMRLRPNQRSYRRRDSSDEVDLIRLGACIGNFHLAPASRTYDAGRPGRSGTTTAWRAATLTVRERGARSIAAATSTTTANVIAIATYTTVASDAVESSTPTTTTARANTTRAASR